MTSGSGKPSRLRVGACLSLSGQFARFGTQAARALHVWADWHGNIELIIEDDQSTKRSLEIVLPDVAGRSDVVLGPYSTMLARRAAQLATDNDWLVWNHGGSGDDVETDYPGYVVSILTPTSRYAYPYLRHLAAFDGASETPLWIVTAPGSFARHITSGAEHLATQLKIPVAVVSADQFTSSDSAPDSDWCLLSVGRFEDDITTVHHTQWLSNPPRAVCAIAAGVREFADQVADSDGIFGIAQWFPGNPNPPALGPTEAELLHVYAAAAGTTPDYPAIQAIAGAVIAEHCATLADSVTLDALWAMATELDTDTLFGEFRINHSTGAQAQHETVLLQWRGGEPRRY